MKERDENLETDPRDKSSKSIPTSNKTQSPRNTNTEEFTKPAETGTPKKVHPEEWRGSHPTKEQNGQQPENNEVDDIKGNEPEEQIM